MNLETALRRLAREPSAPLDVAEVALLVARDEYPSLDVAAYQSELSGLAHELGPRLRGNLQARVEVLCRFLFHELGFRGNARDYHDPRNSYLNEVIDRRTGLPITLCVVAIAVSQRAGLPVSGVGLPGHFIAQAVEGDQRILFDPFHGGRLLSLEECEALVERVMGSAYRVTPEVLQPVPPGPLIQRMLTNLRGVYLRLHDHARAARTIERLCLLCPDDRGHQRDLGAALLQAGRPGQAIGPLEAYLASEPPPEDSRSVRELLGEARGAVARWN